MERLSASGIAGLFENYPKRPRKKTKPGAYLLDVVFPRGHVREHDAIHYLSRCDGISDMHGQNGYARTFEYLEEDMQRLYEQGKWLLAKNREWFCNCFLDQLETKVLNAAAGNIAFKEEGLLMILEEHVGKTFLQKVATILNQASDISSEEAFASNVIAPVLTLAGLEFGMSGSGYDVAGIPYTLPRYRANYGGVEVVCQPDGFCMANGLGSVVEIKSPMFAHYTANAVTKENGKVQSQEDRRKLWSKYLVQIAIEMDVTDAQQAIFLCWFEHSGKIILLSRAQMSPLMAAVKNLVSDLSVESQGGQLAASMEDAFEKVVGATPAKKKSPSRMTIAQIKQELKENYHYTDDDLNLGRSKQAYVDALTDERDESVQLPTNTSFDRVNIEIGRILDQLTPGGTDAWEPLEELFTPCEEDLLKTEAIQKAKKEAAEAAFAAASGESKSEDVASFRTYILDV